VATSFTANTNTLDVSSAFPTDGSKNRHESTDVGCEPQSEKNSVATKPYAGETGTYGSVKSREQMEMSSAGYKTIVALLVCATAVAGCAGNGNGLDSNGNPLPPGSTGTEPLTADFQSIQDNIFTPICSKCHIGAGAPMGLQLDATHSYMALVGVPSTEQPSVLRVAKGDPADSYIIRKLEGVMGISGQRMPYGGPYLLQSTTDVIAQWITNGAQQSTAATVAAAVKATQRFSVAATSPDNDSTVDMAPPRIIVAFSGDIDTNLLNNTTVTLEKIDGIQPMSAMAMQAMASSGTSPGTAMEAAGEITAAAAAATLPVATTVPDGNPSTLLITPPAPLASGSYKVTLHGSLADMNAQALGSDYSFTFTVEAPQ
jgi:methionine-rich copper-binding protein CopC